MPLYEYKCYQCGPFSALRKMSESGLPAICGDCGGFAERVLSAPHFAILAATQRQAYERNEKSAHEPKAIRRSACGCSGVHTCKSTADKAAQRAQPSGAMQMQTKKTARPWMLGH